MAPVSQKKQGLSWWAWVALVIIVILIVFLVVTKVL